MHCTIQGCKWRGQYEFLEQAIAQYLAHTIRDHWDVLQYAHDNPTVLDTLCEL